jgi:hypothetical protein
MGLEDINADQAGVALARRRAMRSLAGGWE